MKAIFSFTRGQQIGILIVAFILFVLYVLPDFVYSNETYTFEVDSSRLTYFEVNLNDSNDTHNFKRKNYKSSNFSKYELKPFDPNVISEQEWESLGFSKKQAQVIFNYCQKKKPLKFKSDLKKIYVISEEKYLELEPYILLPDQIENTLFNLNLITQSELESLPKIGEKFAQRIIKYRNSLGGFYELTQLHEVYGLTDEVYQILVDNCYIDNTQINKIKINHDSKELIDKHPYINFEMTALILKERDKNKIQDLNFLYNNTSFAKEEVDKVKPYISFE